MKMNWSSYKKMWVGGSCALLTITLLVWHSPGPIEGAYEFPLESCCDNGYEFYYLKTNVATLVAERAPPAQRLGSYHKTNGGWWINSPSGTNEALIPLKPNLLFIKIDAPPRQVIAWRTFRFFKIQQILDDPEQWAPKSSPK